MLRRPDMFSTQQEPYPQHLNPAGLRAAPPPYRLKGLFPLFRNKIGQVRE
jgi:hypothetical protein